ncbi:ABC transporter substrate-binding protein [Nocardia sp. NPDC060256]|uniref:bifunctional serine/threonine-protein kinase/ABC transporter substrate-binding protein n=1 Tax=unclassified Nocardia TaxID=2637762 RepID=UPI003669321B
MLRAGEVFAGYVIERRLGHGGMGSVYLARHPRLPRRIALKLLSSGLQANDEMRARFEREAELVAQLDHPNVVAVYDRGVEDGIRWISMQYIDGIDAGALDPRALDPARAVEIIAETAKALDYAHAVGVLHRDVKPANIMLSRPTAGQDERVLLTDFGIARLRDDAHQLTRTGMFAATLAYAAPEQLSATPVDHRSDQYALACTLFWLLSGTAPFTADNPAAMIAAHLHQSPPLLSTRQPHLPPALDAVLTKALAKRPADRFHSCTEFATAARQALASGAQSDHRSPCGPTTTGHAPPTVPQSWVPPHTEPREPSESAHGQSSDNRPRQAESYAPTWQSESAGSAHETLSDAGAWQVAPSGWTQEVGSSERTRQAESESAERGLASGERTRQEDPSASVHGAGSSERTLSEEPSQWAQEGEGPREALVAGRSGGRTARNAGLAGAALVVVAVIVAGFVWANSGSSSDTAAPPTGAGAPHPIDWVRAVAPGTIGASRAFEPLTQIDALGKEVAKPSVAFAAAGDGQATCAPVTIATTAAATQSTGGGVKLAIDQFTKANPGCSVALREFDIAGDPQSAAGVAAQIVNDPSIVALVGPVFSTEIQTAGRVFSDAGLPFLTPSATDPALSTNGWHSFFRALAADDVQGTALAKYLVNTAHFRKICIIQDKSGYGSSLAGSAVSSLGSAADPNCAAAIAKGDRDFTTVTTGIAAAKPDAVFYSGFYEEASALLQQLRRAGSTVPFVSAESTVTPDFVARAGDSATGAIVSCSCGPVVTQFASDYQALNGRAPGPSSVEAYDLTTIILTGIATGRATRPGLVDYLRGYEGTGLARTYRWSSTGELATPQTWLYKVN